MSETVKLIIEIPTDFYEITKAKVAKNMTYALYATSIANGIPLDDAEIEKKFNRINSIASVLRYPQHREIQELLCEILDNIGKGDKEC